MGGSTSTDFLSLRDFSTIDLFFSLLVYKELLSMQKRRCVKKRKRVGKRQCTHSPLTHIFLMLSFLAMRSLVEKFIIMVDKRVAIVILAYTIFLSRRNDPLVNKKAKLIATMEKRVANKKHALASSSFVISISLDRRTKAMEDIVELQLFSIDMSKLAPRSKKKFMQKMQIVETELNQKLLGNLENFNIVPSILHWCNEVWVFDWCNEV